MATTKYKILTAKIEKGPRGFPGPGGAAGGTFVHSELNNLSYALAGHTGFAPIDNPTFTTKVTTPLLKVTTGAAAGNVLISNAAGDLSYLAAGALTKILVGGGAAAPVWTEATGTDAPVRGTAPTITNPVILNINPAANFTLTQNAVVPFTSVNAGAIVNTLYLKEGKVGIGTATPNKKLTVWGAADAIVSIGINATNNFQLSYESGYPIIQSYISGAVGKLILNPNGGSIGIGFTAPLSALCVNGGLHVGGESAAGNDNLWVDGIVQEPNFVTGWLGNNWKIATIGDAEFENLIVRGSARFRELIIDQLAILSGSQLLSTARGKILSINTGASTVTLDDPNNKGACAFLANDFFWIKTVDIDKALFSDCRGQITNVTGVVLTLDFGVAGANGVIADVSEGDVIVQRGHSTTASRQNLIYTTVSDADAPFQRTMTGVNSLAAFNTLANVVLQTGNLASLASHDIVPATPGYGLYSKNVYLSGKIVANSGYIGGITGWVIAAGLISSVNGANTTAMASGGTNAYIAGTTGSPQFIVTHAGALTAKGIAELGTATADYAGKISNIAIQNADIWENSHVGDGSILRINMKGYNGLGAYFRNTEIGDGKGNSVLVVEGSTAMVFADNLRSTGTFRVDGVSSFYGLVTTSEGVHVGGTTDPGTDNLQVDGRVGIGALPRTAGALEITSTTGALIVSRMSTTNQEAMTPTAGMIYYDTTLGHFYGYTNAWRILD